MKQILLALFLVMFSCSLLGHGVAIEDVISGEILEVESSTVIVEIENQVAIVTTTQEFYNNTGSNYSMIYAFPMYEDASAINLRWQIEGNWYEADISPTEQDSIPGTDEMDEDLKEFLGESPLIFSYNENLVPAGSSFTVELTYVQLLPYEMGEVIFSYPNDYSLLQQYWSDGPLLNLTVTSLRTIESIELISHTGAEISNNGTTALLYFSDGLQPDTDFEVRYTLSLDELGLYSMSTNIANEDVPDDFGDGFFTFIVEPEPNANVIDKRFTLIIDKSGSMSGMKIIQAREAASYIVNNLNEGDMFNIVSFSSNATGVFDSHSSYNDDTQSEALSYINNISAIGGTNISGAFELAIPQFAGGSEEFANIIIFFTDGEATIGITQTDALLEHVSYLITDSGAAINLFSFGIGQNINYQLLNLLGTQNGGFGFFLEDSEVASVISEFYNQVRSPVLLDVAMDFTPAGIVEEVYPVILPNLYVGKQLIVSGRYTEPVTVQVNMEGNAFGQDIDYNYDIDLSSEIDPNYQFLTKIWAKQKIEHLLIQYYSYPENSSEAEDYYNQIVEISIQYGVISPFTSFTGPGSPADEDELENEIPNVPYEIVGNYPNPFNPSTAIRFNVYKALNKNVLIKIYNVKGQIVKILGVKVNEPGQYEVFWDGTDFNGDPTSSGIYYYIIDFGDEILSAKMTMMK